MPFRNTAETKTRQLLDLTKKGAKKGGAGALQAGRYAGDVVTKSGAGDQYKSAAKGLGETIRRGVDAVALFGGLSLATVVATFAEHVHVAGVLNGAPTPWTELAILAGGEFIGGAIATASFIIRGGKSARDAAESLATGLHKSGDNIVHEVGDKTKLRR